MTFPGEVLFRAVDLSGRGIGHLEKDDAWFSSKLAMIEGKAV